MDTVFKQIYFSILPELMDRMEEKEDAEELENALLDRADNESKALLLDLIQEYDTWMAEIRYEFFKQGFLHATKLMSEIYRNEK